MTQAVIDCLIASLSEALGIAAIMALLTVLGRYAAKKAGLEAAKEGIERVLKTFLKRTIPGIGLLILILDILYNLSKCMGWI